MLQNFLGWLRIGQAGTGRKAQQRTASQEPIRLRLDEWVAPGAYELDGNPSHADGGANKRTN
jgi:hypothetical protein